MLKKLFWKKNCSEDLGECYMQLSFVLLSLPALILCCAVSLDLHCSSCLLIVTNPRLGFYYLGSLFPIGIAPNNYLWCFACIHCSNLGFVLLRCFAVYLCLASRLVEPLSFPPLPMLPRKQMSPAGFPYGISLRMSL